MIRYHYRLICAYIAVFFLWGGFAQEARPTSGRANPPQYISTNVCSVLDNPKLFLNKEISLRGSVYVGMDSSNIRDKNCPDEGIKLSVEDARDKQSDIVALFDKIRSFGRHGFASISGELVATGSPLTPYKINIHKAWNVTPLPK
jgi:hypothetical protein